MADLKTKGEEMELRYYVTDEQIQEHQKRNFLEIFEWLESTNEFLFRFQTPEARKNWFKLRRGEFKNCFMKSDLLQKSFFLKPIPTK